MVPSSSLMTSKESAGNFFNTHSADTLIVPCPGTQLGESPRWAHGQLRWVDTYSRIVFIMRDFPSHTTVPEQLTMPDEISAIVPTTNPALWLGFGRIGVWAFPDEGTPRLIANVPFDSTAQRFNDGRADANGRSWVSAIVDARTPGAHLYRFDTGSVSVAVDGLIVGNGLAFSPDNRFMYLADTRARCVWRYKFDLTAGTLGERTLFVQYQAGTDRPDGAAVSEDGHYWVAVFEGSRIDRWDQQGKLVCSYPLPVRCPTMPCFAGEDRQWLAVTSAGLDRPENERRGTPAGDLIAFRVDVPGCREHFGTAWTR